MKNIDGTIPVAGVITNTIPSNWTWRDIISHSPPGQTVMYQTGGAVNTQLQFPTVATRWNLLVSKFADGYGVALLLPLTPNAPIYYSASATNTPSWTEWAPLGLKFVPIDTTVVTDLQSLVDSSVNGRTFYYTTAAKASILGLPNEVHLVCVDKYNDNTSLINAKPWNHPLVTYYTNALSGVVSSWKKVTLTEDAT